MSPSSTAKGTGEVTVADLLREDEGPGSLHKEGERVLSPLQEEDPHRGRRVMGM